MIAFPYRTVLLDVDGTLVDSNDAHAKAWVETLAAAGYEVDFARVRPLIGLGGDRLVEQLTGLARDDKANERLGAQRSVVFRSNWLSAVRPLAGARDLVLRLRDLKLPYAIASASTTKDLQPLLEIAGISDLMDVRTSSSDVEESKPDPEIIEAALRKLSASPDSAVMIGDTPYDVRAAKDAAVACIGFTSGGWTAAELAGCAAVVSGPRELATLLAR